MNWSLHFNILCIILFPIKVLIRRWRREEGNLSIHVVSDDCAGHSVHICDAAVAEHAALAGDLAEELFGGVPVADAVEFEELGLLDAVEEGVDGLDGVGDIFDPDCGTENERVSLIGGRKDNTGTIDKHDVLVEVNLLHALGHARSVSDSSCSAALE